TTTIIMSNVDEMQAYLDKKAGGTDERDDTQTTN
ncbi:TPA_asm: terminase small subunit, partial [Listeria monocytogenes]|nr:terminase small subunit [Listeria monocytogenes]